MVDWERLRAGLAGELVLPVDAAYRTARQLQLAEFDSVHPAAVAYCADEDDVRACLILARDEGLPLTARGGGHNFAGWSTTTGLVVDLSRMNAVGLTDRTVRMGPGAQAVDVVLELAPHDRQVITGVCPTVCPAGFLSGGGLGWQTRSHGVGSDRLVSARLVLADGRVVTCSADRDPDLYWALRGGGGGNFGIIVDLEVTPVQVPRLVNFTVVWAWEHALDVLHQWQHWMVDGPPELASEIGSVLPDAAPGAVPFVMLHGGYAGPRERFDEALAELCRAAGAAPVTVEADELPYADAMLKLYRCEGMAPGQRRRVGTTPEATLPRQGFLRERHRLFTDPISRSLTERALAVFDDERRAGQFRYFALTALGGVANRVAATETAYPHRDAQFLVKYTLVGDNETPGEEETTAAEQWTDQGFALLDPHSNGHSYVNYPDPTLDDWKWSYYAENYDRLVEVKKIYDPTGVFTHPQSIGS
ncbi:FAD-binding oxidoreductase [Plantactinospora sp. WMMC1484]|uniref:FAD-binding oxidoreductase n=1 Tax=Plantactinospora sp. WMMC1484 TaxID=3404122 RepID=UPI003BF471E6